MKHLILNSKMAFLLCVVFLTTTPFLWGQPGEYFDIYRVNVKTGEVLQVTDLPGYGEYNPSFSNNGNTIVHDVVSDFFSLLALTNVATGESTPLEGGFGGNDASWSPNGQSIAFDRIPLGEYNLYTLPPAGGDPFGAEPLLIREFGIDPEWSQNSQRLAFTDIFDGSLRTVNVVNGEETIVVEFGLNATWSPNGNYIAYTNGNNLFKIAVNHTGEPQGDPVQLTFDGPDAYNYQPSWSNNSNTIVFHSNRDNMVFDFDIWTVPADGGTPTKLTGLAENGDYDPAFSKDGQWVAYAAVAPPPMPLISIPVNGIVSLNPDANNFTLGQNYPNPFRESTVINFKLPETAAVCLNIYSIQGALVKTLASGQYNRGVHQIIWNGSGNDGLSLPAGIYTYVLSSGKFLETRYMILINK